MEIPANLILIGLHSERPRSGKSTVAAALVHGFGGKVYSLAAGIREVAREMNLHAAADAVGDEKDKPHPDLYGATPREVLIRIGENKVRVHGRDFWLRRLLSQIIAETPAAGDFLAVIDDVRRFEEGQGLVDIGATVCTISRTGAPNVEDINGWTSGRGYTFSNDTTPAECAALVWQRSVKDRRHA